MWLQLACLIVAGSDPFEVHFANPGNNVLSQRLSAMAQNSWQTTKSDYGDLYKGILMTPAVSQDAQAKAGTHLANPKFLKVRKDHQHRGMYFVDVSS